MTMPLAKLLRELQMARVQAERACDLLTNPSLQSVEDCMAALSAAASHVSGCQPELARYAGDPSLRAEAAHLNASIYRAGYLLRTAASHRWTWFQILRAKMANYTAEGSPAELHCPGRVCLQG